MKKILVLIGEQRYKPSNSRDLSLSLEPKPLLLLDSLIPPQMGFPPFSNSCQLSAIIQTNFNKLSNQLTNPMYKWTKVQTTLLPLGSHRLPAFGPVFVHETHRGSITLSSYQRDELLIIISSGSTCR